MTSPTPTSPPLVASTVLCDGHPVAVWSRVPAKPRGTILLQHGRTYSARVGFDLQVPGCGGRSLMEALAQRGWAVYAPDMRGFGATPRDATGFITPDRVVADLAAILEWIRKERGQPATLLGWSLGYALAQLCAQRSPANVAKLILYGAIDNPGRVIPENPTVPLRAVNTTEVALRDFHDPPAVSPLVPKAYMEAVAKLDPISVDWGGREHLRALDCAAIKVPSLLIHADRDAISPLSVNNQIFVQLGARKRSWVTVTGNTHCPHLEDRWQEFVHAVDGFLGAP